MDIYYLYIILILNIYTGKLYNIIYVFLFDFGMYILYIIYYVYIYIYIYIYILYITINNYVTNNHAQL